MPRVGKAFKSREGALFSIGTISSNQLEGGRGLAKPPGYGSLCFLHFAVMMYMCGVRGFSLFGETTVTIECHGMYRHAEDEEGQTCE